MPVVISRALQRMGMDILAARDVRLLGYSDREQLSFAVKENRVIITHDSDFLNLVRKEKLSHHGVLFFTKQVTIGEAIEQIERIAFTYSGEDLKRAVIFLPMNV